MHSSLALLSGHSPPRRARSLLGRAASPVEGSRAVGGGHGWGGQVRETDRVPNRPGPLGALARPVESVALARWPVVYAPGPPPGPKPPLPASRARPFLHHSPSPSLWSLPSCVLPILPARRWRLSMATRTCNPPFSTPAGSPPLRRMHSAVHWVPLVSASPPGAGARGEPGGAGPLDEYGLHRRRSQDPRAPSTWE